MREKILAVVIFVSIFGVMLCGWIYQSKVEAETYNRLTGRDVTHWEAMWTNLRVDCN